MNLVAPNPVTNREFTQILSRVLHRPAFLPVPAFAVRGIFGEMGEELLLAGSRVVPKKLVDAGCSFCHADLRSALEDILR